MSPAPGPPEPKGTASLLSGPGQVLGHPTWSPRGYRGHTRPTSVFPAQPQKPAGSGRILEVEEGEKRGSFGENKGLGAGRTCFA